MNYNLKLSELLQDATTWAELKAKLEDFNTSQTETTAKKTTAGKLFEYFTKYYFTLNPEYSQLYTKVWLYDEIPTEIKLQLNFPDRDFGIDLLLQDKQNRFTAVQCKFKNDEDYILKWKRDSIAHPFALADKCEAVMIFTNAAGCVSEIEQRGKYVQVAIGELINTSAEVLSAIKLFIDTNTIKSVEKYPRLPHQIIAVNKTVEYLSSNPRAQLILPCGAGKTLASLWIKEDLQSKNTLVLFPSLALLRQFKTEWANQRSEDYIYINVCSERDIDVASEDSTVTHTYEISGEVTTSPKRISEFLSGTENKNVFSTYQSIQAVEVALKHIPDFSFDLVICDEAHKTAGPKANTFAIVHDQSRIRGKKRLYMTATPKVVSTQLKAKLGDDYELLCDMSKVEVFGDEAHRMSFWEAIQQKILVDYKIIGIGVTHKQVKEFIDKRRYVTEKYDMKEIADNYALDIAMDKYSAFHAITFHSRVKSADEFAKRHNAYFAPNVYARHVSGEQTTSKRAKILTEFKLHKKGIVSNARCLTEGVDVPIIDLIYFCDPKNSKIDIVQASGRALRKDRHGKKPIGYIVVPIYHHIDEDIEKEIEKKPYFQNLIQVIRSLCDQDERLRAEIADVAFEKGERKSKRIEITYNDEEIEKIVKLEGLDKKVREFLFDQIIDKTRDYWEVKYRQLRAYIEKYGDSTISRNNKEYRDLFFWIGNIRKAYHEGRLSQEKIKRLEEIGFDWKGEQRHSYLPPDVRWRRNYEKLKKYFEVNGNSDIPSRYEKDKSLANWAVAQRVNYRNNEKLTGQQIALLEQINFNWDPKSGFVAELIEELKSYKKKYGHVLVPTQGKGGKYVKLGGQVNRVRMTYRKGKPDDNGNVFAKGYGKISKAEIDELNSIGFQWNILSSDWNESFLQLKEYYEKHGHSSVRQSESPSLYQWRYKQIKRQAYLTEEQKTSLATINFDCLITDRIGKDKALSAFEIQQKNEWLRKFEQLNSFVIKYRHTSIPRNSKENKWLAHWLMHQRRAFKKGKLARYKIQKFKSINVDLTHKRDENYKRAWLKQYKRLVTFQKRYGSCNPSSRSGEFKTLGQWAAQQRHDRKKDVLESDKIDLLNKISFKWSIDRTQLTSNSIGNLWLAKHQLLIEYQKKFKTASVPQKHKGLGRWVGDQRVQFKKGKLSQEKIDKLNALSFVWEAENVQNEELFNTRFNELIEFKKLYGNFKVPQKCKEFPQLGTWLSQIKFRGTSPERVKRLNDIGLVWKPRSSNSSEG